MIRLVKTQLGIAFSNPWFFVALVWGIALAVFDAVEVMRFQGEGYASALADTLDPLSGVFMPFSSYSCFSMWMSVHYDTSWSMAFYRLAPLLATMPYSWSMADERQSGYVVQVCTRVDRGRYFAAKVIAVFLTGGTVVVIPHLVNLAALATVFPAYVPEIFDAVSIGVFDDNLWSDVFYSVPGCYVALYSVLDFALCGLWSVFVMALGCITKNRVIVLVAPYLGLTLLQFLNERIFIALGGIRGFQLSLFENLHAYSTQYVQSGWVILGEAVVLAGAVAALALVGCRRDEL